jgi:hypothetical protein
MKEEIFKLNYESYTTVVCHNTVPITFPHPDNKNKLCGHEDNGIWGSVVNVIGSSNVYLKNYNSNVKEDFVLNYGNPLSGVIKTYFMVVVERNGDKVSLKVFNGFRERKIGNKWFKISKNVEYITVNTKTGDVYFGFLRNYQNKKKVLKNLMKNIFFTEPILTLMSLIRNKVWDHTQTTSEVAKEAVSKFMNEIDGGSGPSEFSFEQRLFKFYLDKKGIKYPNNFQLYSGKLYGNKIRKILKKNDNRIVDAFMIHNGLTGKKLKKALHCCTGINLDLYLMSKKLFGEDWINQDDDFILNTLNCVHRINESEIPTEFANLISKDELRRVFSIFKKVFFESMLDTYTFVDHISIYVQLKMHGETDLKWMSYEVDSQFFRNEHLDWSDKLSFYKRGFYERIYPDYSYEYLEQPIGEYYPLLLNDTTSYNEESSVQSNCVKTYIGKSSRMIISLRKGSIDSDERATIEYYLYRENDKKIKCKRVQSLGKYNGVLSDEWTQWILKLDLKMSYYVNDNRFETVKITKKCNNGTFLESDSYWDENGVIRWANKIDEKTKYEWIT